MRKYGIVNQTDLLYLLNEFGGPVRLFIVSRLHFETL